MDSPKRAKEMEEEGGVGWRKGRKRSGKKLRSGKKQHELFMYMFLGPYL